MIVVEALDRNNRSACVRIFNVGVCSRLSPVYSVKNSCKQYNISNEDMILALAGKFKQLSHEPEKFR